MNAADLTIGETVYIKPGTRYYEVALPVDGAPYQVMATWKNDTVSIRACDGFGQNRVAACYLERA